MLVKPMRRLRVRQQSSVTCIDGKNSRVTRVQSGTCVGRGERGEEKQKSLGGTQVTERSGVLSCRSGSYRGTVHDGNGEDVTELRMKRVGRM